MESRGIRVGPDVVHCHVIIGYLRAVCNDCDSAAETRRRIAHRRTPGGGNYYGRTFRLPSLIILGGRDLPKIAPKWLVTSESKGINDCCASIVDEIAAARPVSSDTRLVNQSLLFLFFFSTRFTVFPLAPFYYDKRTKKQFTTKKI